MFTDNEHPEKPTTIQVTYSVRDHVKNVKRTMSKTIFVPAATDTTTPDPVPGLLLNTDVTAQVVSPSGAKRAVWRKSEKDRFVELWEGEALVRQWLVTDVHGDVYTDGEQCAPRLIQQFYCNPVPSLTTFTFAEYFSSFYFSHSESSLVYVAEQKTPETKDPFAKFRFTPDFGEGLVGKRRPGIFILRCEEGSELAPVLVQPVAPVDGTAVHFGQPVFSALVDDAIYATGYESTVDGRLLGIKGCFNRPSGIWRLCLSPEEEVRQEGKGTSDSEKEGKKAREISAKCTKLTPSHLSCRSPRTVTYKTFGTDIQKLFWLACRSGGAHLATSMVYAVEITDDRHLSPNSTKWEIVSIVDAPSPNMPFPGLYPDYNFAAVPFVLQPGEHAPAILIASTWGSRKTIVRVNSDAAVVDMTPPESDADAELFSWSLLGTDGWRRVLCSRSSPAVPYEVVLGLVQNSGDIVWRVVDRPSLTKEGALLFT